MRKKIIKKIWRNKYFNSELFSVLSALELRITFYEAYYQHVKKFVLYKMKKM